MTRAQNELALIAPLKFHLTHQSRQGDAHVYGGRSRFLTEKVLKTLEAVAFQGSSLSGENLGEGSAAVSVDVGARLREMW
jgi:DNA helicase II / ATP-dependent DNA helicase PcrA